MPPSENSHPCTHTQSWDAELPPKRRTWGCWQLAVTSAVIHSLPLPLHALTRFSRSLPSFSCCFCSLPPVSPFPSTARDKRSDRPQPLSILFPYRIRRPAPRLFLFVLLCSGERTMGRPHPLLARAASSTILVGWTRLHTGWCAGGHLKSGARVFGPRRGL